MIYAVELPEKAGATQEDGSEIKTLIDILGCTKAFDILWVENPTDSALLKERESLRPGDLEGPVPRPE